jgi:dTDP-4-dehydrorhamnose reductase
MSPQLRIVVIGRRGQVARSLARVLSPLGEVICVGRPEVDLLDVPLLRKVVRDLRPNVLINAAAYTAVDLAESEPEMAMKINAEAPAVMAEEAKQLDAVFVSYSSDFVFDGEKRSPYLETDSTNPLNAYGASKLAGDLAVEAIGGAYLIFRTSWVYSSVGKNFLNTIAKLAIERDELRVVDDQIGAPTWSKDIADATMKIIAQAVMGSQKTGKRLCEELGPYCGKYNMTSGESISWFGFAVAIIEELAKKRGSKAGLARVVPIPSSQYASPARRPLNSRLSNEKLQRTFQISLPHWRESLALMINEGPFLEGLMYGYRKRFGLWLVEMVIGFPLRLLTRLFLMDVRVRSIRSVTLYGLTCSIWE